MGRASGGQALDDAIDLLRAAQQAHGAPLRDARQCALQEALARAPDAVLAQGHGQRRACCRGGLDAHQSLDEVGQRPVHQHRAGALGAQAVQHAQYAPGLAAQHGVRELEHVVARHVQHGLAYLLPAQNTGWVEQA